MDRYVKPHGGLRIANYGDVVTFLGYGKVWDGWDGAKKPRCFIEVAKQRLTRLVGQSFCEEFKLYKQILYVNMLQGLNGRK